MFKHLNRSEVGVPYGYIEDKVLYRASFADVEALKLVEVVEEEVDKHVADFEAKFDKLRSKLDGVVLKIEASNNKGSFFSSLMNIKETIKVHEGLGDYQALLDRIGLYESLINDFIQKNRQKNTDIKKALLAELDYILQNNDMQEAFEQIKDLKQRWIKTGAPDPSVSEEMEARFKEAMDSFFEKRKSFMEAKKMVAQARVEDYQEIIDQIQGFIDSNQVIKSQQKVKELQKQWKESGRIPEEQFKQLNDHYWKVTQVYFEKLKGERATEKKSRAKSEKDSVEGRKVIIAAMEALVERGTFEIVKKELDELSSQWKKAGHLSKAAFQDIQNQYYASLKKLQEKQFVLSLAAKKNKGFDSKSEEEKISILIKTLRNVLRRDEDELSSFSDNMEKMTINKGSFVDMLESKLSVLKGKVALKKADFERISVIDW